MLEQKLKAELAEDNDRSKKKGEGDDDSRGSREVEREGGASDKVVSLCLHKLTANLFQTMASRNVPTPCFVFLNCSSFSGSDLPASLYSESARGISNH